MLYLFREEVENSQEETDSKGIEGDVREDGEKDSKGQQGMPCRRETHI